jgi:TIR domain
MQTVTHWNRLSRNSLRNLKVSQTAPGAYRRKERDRVLVHPKSPGREPFTGCNQPSGNSLSCWSRVLECDSGAGPRRWRKKSRRRRGRACGAAIRLRDKVLLILSEQSIKSDWVEDEVTAGFEEERKRGQVVLFPVRLDETVMKTNEAWAAKLRALLIGDFQHWRDYDAYKRSFERVVRDLTKREPSSSRP